MSFTKILNSDLTGKGVLPLSDPPGISVEALKAALEEIVRDVAIVKFNALIDELEAQTSADSIGAENSLGVATTVQALLDLMNFGGKEAQSVVTNDDTKIPTGAAIVAYMTAVGSGDMQKAIYDTTASGVVDNAEKLGSQLPAYYGTAAQISNLSARGNSIGNSISDAFSSSKTYALNDFAIYSDTLYKYTTAITSAGAWDSSKWTEITVAELFTRIGTVHSITIASTDIWTAETGGFYIEKDLDGLTTDMILTRSLITSGNYATDDEATDNESLEGVECKTADKVCFHATAEFVATETIQVMILGV